MGPKAGLQRLGNGETKKIRGGATSLRVFNIEIYGVIIDSGSYWRKAIFVWSSCVRGVSIRSRIRSSAKSLHLMQAALVGRLKKCFGTFATRSTLPVALEVDACHEVVEAVRAARGSLATVRLLMVDHVAKLGRLDVAEHALKKLISAARRLIDQVLFDEAHMASVMAVPVAHALLNHFAVTSAYFARRGVLSVVLRHFLARIQAVGLFAR